MALTAAREIPARFAKSACDHSRACRRANTGFIDMILSFIDTIASFAGNKNHTKRRLCCNYDTNKLHFSAKSSDSLEIKAFFAI